MTMHLHQLRRSRMSGGATPLPSRLRGVHKDNFLSDSATNGYSVFCHLQPNILHYSTVGLGTSVSLQCKSNTGQTSLNSLIAFISLSLILQSLYKRVGPIPILIRILQRYRNNSHDRISQRAFLRACRG